MSLPPGTRIGVYPSTRGDEILSSLGAGGMGEVYRAKDSKLKREMALKVLPADSPARAGPGASRRPAGPHRSGGGTAANSTTCLGGT